MFQLQSISLFLLNFFLSFEIPFLILRILFLLLSKNWFSFSGLTLSLNLIHLSLVVFIICALLFCYLTIFVFGMSVDLTGSPSVHLYSSALVSDLFSVPVSCPIKFDWNEMKWNEIMKVINSVRHTYVWRLVVARDLMKVCLAETLRPPPWLWLSINRRFNKQGMCVKYLGQNWRYHLRATWSGFYLFIYLFMKLYSNYSNKYNVCNK